MMKFIGVQKHINLPRLIIVALNAILLLLGNALYSEIATAQRENSRLTFADWCRQKDSLSPEAKHTVEVLLEEAETTECDAADRELSTLPGLDLGNNQISDIKPLESLINLNLLYLNNNQISDIKPLASLTNLDRLYLYNNQISDIKPLASLTNLSQLSLNSNQISDIKPLASLTNLTLLSLNSNQISDIKPLASLTNLSQLSLGGNPIAPKTCPLKPESICNW